MGDEPREELMQEVLRQSNVELKRMRLHLKRLAKTAEYFGDPIACRMIDIARESLETLDCEITDHR